MKESKVVVWEGLINSWEKKRSEKQRGKGEIYATECSSRKTKGDKKALLNEQFKEIEENSRLGKTRNLFKKIGDTKGTFHENIGTIKDKNSKDLTEAKDIKKKWQEYTEELYKKVLNDPDNHDGVITHLESDSLECVVNCALGSITKNQASGGDSSQNTGNKSKNKQMGPNET